MNKKLIVGFIGLVVALAFATSATAAIFSTTLRLGSVGQSVRDLQVVLNSSADTQVSTIGTGSPGSETSYFGYLTRAAVIKFQNKYASEILIPIGLTSGTGIVGASTRVKLNYLSWVGAVPQSVVSVVPSPTANTPVTSPTAGFVFSPTNDFLIILHCLIVPTYHLCARADLNNDGKTDGMDVTLFASKAGRLDIDQNKILNLASLQTPTSCFFKKNTVDISSLLPRAQSFYSDEYSYLYWGSSSGCSGDSDSLPPTIGCNGTTWLKASTIGRICATDMPFAYDYTGAGQYTKFQNWVTGASSGSRVNLSTLFVTAFFDAGLFSSWESTGVTGFSDAILARVSYTTIAQYDLDNNGTADFSAGGNDMAVFRSCVGAAVSGVCAQADFSGDGVIDIYDLSFRDFMVNVLFRAPDTVTLVGSVDSTGNPLVVAVGAAIPSIIANSSFIPYLWHLNQFESIFFASAKYNDRQIVQYCVGRKPFEKCGAADINDSCFAEYRNCGVNMSCRATAANCKVDSVDVTAFDTIGGTLDFNSDGVVNLP